MVKLEPGIYQNPPGYEIDFDIIQSFEFNLDLRRPEKNLIPNYIIAYGRLCTVLELKTKHLAGLVFKRISVFKTNHELNHFLEAWIDYSQLLQNNLGLKVPAQGYAICLSFTQRPVLYIIQEKMPAHALGHNAIHLVNRAEMITFFGRILELLLNWSKFNHDYAEQKISLGGHLSDWVIEGYDPQRPGLDQDAPLIYIDSSVPIFKSDGIEKIDRDLMMRSIPSLLKFFVHKSHIEVYFSRFYNIREVVINILADFYKEKRPDLIPELVMAFNQFSIQGNVKHFDLKPIQIKEVKEFYRKDIAYHSILSITRKFDRS